MEGSRHEAIRCRFISFAVDEMKSFCVLEKLFDVPENSFGFASHFFDPSSPCLHRVFASNLFMIMAWGGFLVFSWFSMASSSSSIIFQCDK